MDNLYEVDHSKTLTHSRMDIWTTSKVDHMTTLPLALLLNVFL